MAKSTRFPVRIYYEDTDFSGNVYHANYVKFFERARTEWLRALDVHHHLLAEQGIAFAVRHMDISFEAPSHIDDMLEIETRLTEARGARIILKQTAYRSSQILCQANVVIAAINSIGRPARLPKALRDALLG